MNTTHIDVIVKSAAQRAASKKTEKTEHKKFSSCGQPFCPPPLRMIAYEDMKPNL